MPASITLLPAMLGFVGAKIDRFRVPFVYRDEGHHRPEPAGTATR
jgi:hypothetical protein